MKKLLILATVLPLCSYALFEMALSKSAEVRGVEAFKG